MTAPRPGSASRLSRRQFLNTTAAHAAGLSAFALLAEPRCAAAGADRYGGLAGDKYLGSVKVVTTVVDEKAFTEGPAVDREGNVFFTNAPMSKILRWEPKRQQLSVFRENSNEANGLCFDPQGRLLACEGSAGRVTRTELRTGRVEVLASTFNGFPLAAPNDLCLDEQGRVYFTSRPGAKDPREGNVNAVYRIDVDGSLHQILAWPNIHMPNGIATSPDNKTLYVVETHPNSGYHRDIRAYDLQPDGSLSRERVVINFYPGRSGDGMRIDAEGNLYIAAGLHKTRGSSETLDTRPGIHVVSPEGKLLAFRETPVDTVTNCAFGGPDLKTLYVTCGPHLLSIRTQIPGKASCRPNS